MSVQVENTAAESVAPVMEQEKTETIQTDPNEVSFDDANLTEEDFDRLISEHEASDFGDEEVEEVAESGVEKSETKVEDDPSSREAKDVPPVPPVVPFVGSALSELEQIDRSLGAINKRLAELNTVDVKRLLTENPVLYHQYSQELQGLKFHQMEFHKTKESLKQRAHNESVQGRISKFIPDLGSRLPTMKEAALELGFHPNAVSKFEKNPLAEGEGMLLFLNAKAEQKELSAKYEQKISDLKKQMEGMVGRIRKEAKRPAQLTDRGTGSVTGSVDLDSMTEQQIDELIKKHESGGRVI